MPEETLLCFGPFRIDVVNEEVWRGQETLKLARKALAVLRYLIEHPGQLVTKEGLFTAIWPGVVVGDAALTVCIREVRQALGDEAKAPQYIETVYGRGYRFIAAVRSSEFGVQSQNSQSTPSPQHPAPTLVGREVELAQLHQWLDKALGGERQIVFITGEPGIGKTTLIEVFLARAVSSFEFQVSSSPPHSSRTQSSALSPQSLNVQSPTPQSQIPPLWVGRGQCIEHYGAGEGYLPILTALEQLCREPGHERLLSLLRQYAPLWLVQLPSFLSAEEHDQLQREVQGTTRERMLREMATLLEVLTAETLLILVLEDLHWSDPSTLDLLAMVARRREPARLLILGTYRPSELLAKDHPLRMVIQELLAHQQCQELALGDLAKPRSRSIWSNAFLSRSFRPVWLKCSISALGATHSSWSISSITWSRTES